MRRIIEILKAFQNDSQSLFLPYLIKKFSITLRTLQKDVQRINTLLAEVSNCKIIKSKDWLIIIGTNPKKAINNLLVKLLKSSNNDSVKFYQILLYFICETKAIANSKLISFINGDLYSLNQKLSSINNFFQYYQLNLSLKFKNKEGWILVGCEKDLRILATNILINNPLYPDVYLDFNLFYLFNKLNDLLFRNIFFNYYFNEIVYFLIILIKRIKLNKTLNKYHSHFLLADFLPQKKIIENHCQQLISILEKKFSLKVNAYERDYLKDLMFFNQKTFSDSLFSELKKFINDLIFKKYQFSLMIENFKLILSNFLKENYLKLLFNFYKSFEFNDIKKPLLFSDSYYYGWEILTIVLFALRKFHVNISLDLFINDYLLANFDNLYLRKNQKNWKIPLYYQPVTNSHRELYEINKIILFIKTKYPNIILKSLKIDNNIYKFNFLNQDYSVLIHNNINFDLSQFKKIFPVKYHDLIPNQLQKNIDLVIKLLMFNKVCSSILIFDFFFKQKFYDLKSFLNFFQNLLIRKFKINWINFELRNAFIYQKFFQKNILLIHKMVPINNIELPIILIYFKNPLFFSKKSPIHFIFILITNSKSLYQYNWIISYLNCIKSNLNPKIDTIKSLYKTLNDSISIKS